MRGLFEEVIFLPRLYLSALGLKRKRGHSVAVDGRGLRPALMLDLGAGVAEVGRIGQSYPSIDETAAVNFGGDQVDLIISETLRKDCLALVPDRRQIREWKDNFVCVGTAESHVVVKVPADGTEQSLALSNAWRRGRDV